MEMLKHYLGHLYLRTYLPRHICTNTHRCKNLEALPKVIYAIHFQPKSFFSVRRPVAFYIYRARLITSNECLFLRKSSETFPLLSFFLSFFLSLFLSFFLSLLLRSSRRQRLRLFKKLIRFSAANHF